MKNGVLRSRSAQFIAALLTISAATGCHHHPDHYVLDRNALLNQLSRQNRVCLEHYVIAQTPQRTDAQGHHPSTYLIGAEIINGRAQPAAGPLRLRMTVTGGGHSANSAPPHVEVPLAAPVPPGRTRRTPFLVTIPAVEGQAYAIDIRLWEPGSADGDDDSYCQHRQFTFS